ncbi:hypothetical protein G5B38_10480 [Pseudohalocynthiibacter aestuariivivens]|nr:hypothetical protein [Pseudohalocynthiibacter aestuariivivens]QIE45920.1 hypothetical protein G5B38_10480 [Pseudohalocynthiibacter aestuariivivens]
MALTLLHTADIHRATFDTLRDRIAPNATLHHKVRPDWLARAQNGIDASLEVEITAAVSAASGSVLCTCTTLGPTAAKAGAMVIDAPMMQAAAERGGTILMAYCLPSTRAPSLAALEAAIAKSANFARAHPLLIGGAWPLFEAGNGTGFAIRIAEAITQEAAEITNLGSIVLAQASMLPAAPLLGGLGAPVLTSPELALRAALNC